MDDAKRVLRERFGHRSFRPGQEQLIQAVLQGRDALGVLPTGGGKSLCFQLPTVLLGGLTVVVSPLISLMRDQLRRAKEVGIPSEALHSTLSQSARDRIRRDLARGAVRLLFVAPERLASPEFRRLLTTLPVRLVAIDEAHCITSWGHDFRPAYRRLRGLRPANVPVLAVTATATPTTAREIVLDLGLREPVRVTTSFDRPNLFWAVSRVSSTAEQAVCIARLRRRTPGAVLVYAGTRRRVATLRRGLADQGVVAVGYHAGLPPPERGAAESWFASQASPTLVATNAFGMGIDRSDVRLVVHVDLPLSLEALYQEAGRAGRDGGSSVALALLRAEGEGGRAVLAAEGDPGRSELGRAARVLRGAQEAAGGPLPSSAAAAALEEAMPGRPIATMLARLESVGVILALGGRAGDPRLHVRPGPPAGGPLRRLRRLARTRRKAVDRYAAARTCRRRCLLAYFGERTAPNRCETCDCCRPRWLDATLVPISGTTEPRPTRPR